MTAFEDYVNTELPKRLAIATAVANSYARFTGTGKQVEARTPAQVLADIVAAAASHGIAAHTAHGTWKVVYTDGSGNQQELSLGGVGRLLRSAGASSPPTMSTIYSVHTYVFTPDAALGATVTAGDQQGLILHSGLSTETANRLYIDAETAPGASGLPITIQFGDTNDLDTVASWTTIATLTLSSEKSAVTTSMSEASIPANRLIRMNVGTIVGTPKDVSISLVVKRPVSA